MEPKAKKLKLSEENVSLDPLERIHSDLHNLVFQHFKGKEVKKFSKLATNWYLNLGSSKVAMNKIQMRFTSKQNHETLLTSQRRYSNFMFSFPYKATAVQRFNTLKAFADSIEHLELKKVVKNFQESVPDVNSVDFPKLKSLKLAYCDNAKSQLKFAQLVIDKSNKEELKKIHLAHYTPNMLKIALEMPKLKYFGIDFLCDNPIKNAELPVNKSVTAAAFDGSFPNMKSLINSLPNLEEMEIRYISSETLMFVAENSPKLQKLYFSFHSYLLLENVNEMYERLKLANPFINQNIELIQKPKGFKLMHQN
jgi:hypothetical protein